VVFHIQLWVISSMCSACVCVCMCGVLGWVKETWLDIFVGIAVCFLFCFVCGEERTTVG